jgi:alkanesulfonate monooxygenase SsuD/methylene tetrahydromethanopterin reductase-like flavin-dependent oxidoreductase (luciferase family)
MSDTNMEQEPNGNLPAWVRLAAWAAKQFGLWAVVAVGLILFLGWHVSAAIAQVSAKVDAHATEAGRDSSELSFYLRALCFNAADDEAERAACIPPRQMR